MREVAIERPDGPVVDALLEAGLTVVVISPNQVKNLRGRYGSAGNKDDRFDAFVLADTLRTDRARLRPGETALVLGAAGGTGLAAVQLAKLMGARVIAAASAGKLETCREAGADALVDYRQEKWRDTVRGLAGDAGVDVVYDPVGGPYSEPALRSLGWGGRHLVVGFAAGDIPRVPLNLALLKGCDVLGVFYGGFAKREPDANRALVEQLLSWVRDGKLRPRISAAHALEDAAAALDALLSRGATGKIVLVVEPPPGR